MVDFNELKLRVLALRQDDPELTDLVLLLEVLLAKIQISELKADSV